MTIVSADSPGECSFPESQITAILPSDRFFRRQRRLPRPTYSIAYTPSSPGPSSNSQHHLTFNFSLNHCLPMTMGTLSYSLLHLKHSAWSAVPSIEIHRVNECWVGTWMALLAHVIWSERHASGSQPSTRRLYNLAQKPEVLIRCCSYPRTNY